VWERTYRRRVVEPIERTARLIAVRGAAFVPDARLADFAHAMSRFEVVALLTHSRLCALDRADVVDPAAYLAALRSPRSLVAERLRDYTAQFFPGLLTDEPKDARAQVAESLNRLIEPTHRHFQREPPAEGGGGDDDFELSLTRLEVEAEFPEALAPSGAVEFFDGMATVYQVGEAIPRDFHGVLDLAICNSSFVGRLAKRARGFPGLVYHNDFSADAQLRVIQFGLTVERLAFGPCSYVEAADETLRFLLREMESR
jgi:hypothetical protein